MRYFIFLLSLAGAAIILQSCKQTYASPPAATSEAAVPVVARRLETTVAPIPIEASGMVASKEVVNLSFKISGIIEYTAVEEGQQVKAGQQLARLNSTEVDAQVLKARQGLAKAERDVGRIEQLYADTAATLEQVQDLNTALEIARAELEIARFNREYAQIVAPVSGRITRQFSEAGELINPGAPVYSLASSGQKGYVIRIGIADKDIVRLKMGDRAEVRFDAYPQAVIPAFVAEIAEAADPRTGVFEIELALQPEGRTLRNGFIGKAVIFPSAQAPYYKIPMNALVEGYPDKANIFLADTASRRALKHSIHPRYIGPDFFTADIGSLPPGGLVVTEGAAYLSDSSHLQIVRETAPILPSLQ